MRSPSPGQVRRVCTGDMAHSFAGFSSSSTGWPGLRMRTAYSGHIGTFPNLLNLACLLLLVGATLACTVLLTPLPKSPRARPSALTHRHHSTSSGPSRHGNAALTGADISAGHRLVLGHDDGQQQQQRQLLEAQVAAAIVAEGAHKVVVRQHELHKQRALTSAASLGTGSGEEDAIARATVALQARLAAEAAERGLQQAVEQGGLRNKWAHAAGQAGTGGGAQFLSGAITTSENGELQYPEDRLQRADVHSKDSSSAASPASAGKAGAPKGAAAWAAKHLGLEKAAGNEGPAMLRELQAATDVLFTRLLPAQLGGAAGPAQGQQAQHLPLELSQPGAMELLTLLQRVWQAHAHTAASTASGAAGGGAVTTRALKVHQRRAAATGGVQVPTAHCSTREGAQLLKQVAKAVEALHAHTCSADRGTGERREESTLPFVLLRRVSMAVLQLAYLSNTQDKADSACRIAVDEVSAATQPLTGPLPQPMLDASRCSTAAAARERSGSITALARHRSCVHVWCTPAD